MDSLVPWEAHLEVWVLIFGVACIGWFMINVLQPKAVQAGHEPINLRQKLLFILASVLLWIVSDWPVHEIAELQLYFVHMLQHLMISMIIPALFLLSLPRWLFETVFDEGKKGWKFLQKISRPIFAGIIFNIFTVLLHWPWLVQLSADSGSVHFALHLVVFLSGLLMWMPVIGPIKEWQLPAVGKCIYLFAMSIVPTVPGGWLVFAEQVVYRHYDTPERLWGINAIVDQQAAGVVMKLVGGFFLWAVIVTIFFRWANSEMKNEINS